MDILESLKAFLQTIIVTGGAVAIIACLIKSAYSDEGEKLRKRAINILIFVILSQLIIEVYNILVTYLGEGGNPF